MRFLREQHPEAEVEVVGLENWQVAGDLVDRIHSVDGAMFAQLFSKGPSPELLSWLGGADRLVVWMSRGMDAILQILIPGRLLLHTPYPPPGMNAAHWLMQAVGVPVEEMERRAAVPLDLPDEAAPDRPWTVLHPGAGAPWKRWPAERFAQLVAPLEGRGHRVTLLAGPADEAAVAQVQAALGRPLPVMRGASLRGLATSLRHARLYIGNDSGATHLAAAAGAPAIVLFGPTDPVSWAPPYPWVQVVRVCTRRTTQQGQFRICDEPDCMEAITVDQVLSAIFRYEHDSC